MARPGASSPEQVAIAAIFLKLSLLNRAHANQVCRMPFKGSTSEILQRPQCVPGISR